MAIFLLLAVARCGADSSGPTDLGLPLTGTFTGTVAGGGTAHASIVAGRSGATFVRVCGPDGANFDLVVGGQRVATPSNCEETTFDAVVGRSYAIQVHAVAGAGAYNGCWSTALVRCTVTIPGPHEAYYATAVGKTGQALIDALHQIVRTGHRVLGYEAARDELYADVDDPDNDDTIVDVYLGRAATDVNSRATAAAAGFNTEHAWPRSRGAEQDPALSDLHHLFTADATANSQRLNYAFGEVAGTVIWTGPDASGTGERSRLGISAAGDTVFEVRRSKRGDVARAIFYFYVRYKKAPTASFLLRNFNREEATLLRWAADDPPDEFERQRNDLIFQAQGNRNPFVDRPEFLTAAGDWPNQ